MLIDISPPISASTCVWPGDVPVSREVGADIHRGDDVTLSALRSTVHVGAHADAPSHIVAGGATIDQCPLDAYVGPCQVVAVNVPLGTAITPAMIATPVRAERVLLATGTYPDPTAFNRDFAGLSVELVDHLHAAGVRLVGIDTPSVDPLAADDLPVHRRLVHHGIAILEGLVLAEVPAGEYELIALPLRLVGFDASPVRAVLRTLGQQSAA